MRRLRLDCVLLFLVILAAGCASPAEGARKPNILLIVADDLGYGELSCQGNPQIPTPHIDSIARNGIRFTSGYVSGPYCSPTRAGLLTGRYQQRFGHEFNPGPVPGGEFGLPLTETTLPDRLKAAGYATGMFGKWHLGNAPAYHPLKRGFDEFYGFLGGAHSYVRPGEGPNAILDGTTPVPEVGYTTEEFARRTAGFIEKNRGKSWFAYLPFNAVHGPLEATEKYLARFPNIEDRRRRTFAAMLSAMDDAVGAVLNKVRELGLEEDTLVFFFSDNGGPTRQITSKNDPLRGFKAQTWEGGIRVPFMLQWKGRLPAGKVDDRPVIQLDLFTTALAAADFPVKPEWKVDGVNLLPYLDGKESGAPHKALYWRFGQQLAIRKGDWKLVKAPGAGTDETGRRGSAEIAGAHLYNLASDIGEKTNLADREPERVKELAADWARWNAELAPPKWFPGQRRRQRNRQRANPPAPMRRPNPLPAATNGNPNAG